MECSWTINLPDEQHVQKLAGKFAARVAPPAVLYLRGDLGAGKTTFARAFIHALDYPGYVKSPSYGLLESYALADRTVLHLDLYRIEDPEELEYLALRDIYDKRTLLLIEWPDRGVPLLPAPDLVLNFDESPEGRFVKCQGVSTQGQRIAQQW